MRLLTVDPGLDFVAGALFDTSKVALRTLPDAILAYECSVSGKTSPREPMPVRCASLAEWARETVAKLDVQGVVIEEPPTWHAARQKSRIPAGRVLDSIAKLHQAIGALHAGFMGAGVPVATRPAPRDRKDYRRELVGKLLAGRGLAPLRNADLIDALYLGLLEACDPTLDR